MSLLRNRLTRRVFGFRMLFSLSTLAAATVTAGIGWPEIEPVRGAGDRFEGRLVLEPLADPSGKMRLAETFAYVDPAGRRWVAPAGEVTDGASIPRVLYSVVGDPFGGPYLRAAVIHDAHCPSSAALWRDVHRAFYYACLKAGVGETKAKVMFAAVYHFGPRWPDPSRPDDAPYADSLVRRKLAADGGAKTAAYDPAARAIAVPGVPEERADAVSRVLFEKCRAWIEREDPSLDTIEDWTAGMGAM